MKFFWKYRLLIIVILLATFLRLWKLDQVPVSLFGDELDVGYHAYSILKTARDYSGNFMPLHFQSFAEWRTPLYLYSAVPTVWLFGISPLGVRLPAAIFGILGVYAMYLFVNEVTKNKKAALVSSLILAISPWHLQYSRAAFEVTELIFFLLLGLWLFYKSLNNGKYLWVSGLSLLLMPWIYSTAKFFTPVLIILLVILNFKILYKIKPKYILQTIIISLALGIPMILVTFFGGAAQRFSYISIFTDPTLEPEISISREIDASSRGKIEVGNAPMLIDRVFHNKINFWGNSLFRNYSETLSADFLFNSGDPNSRHSINGMGELYKIELPILVLGAVLFFAFYKDKKFKTLILFWIIAGVLPASLTRDGGNHATRLIMILPPLIFLTAYGLTNGVSLVKTKYKSLVIATIAVTYLIIFVDYQHLYWIHNPVDSERLWHYGWKQAVSYVKENESKYDKIIISTKGEPPWIFFAANYLYSPDQWQKKFPLKNSIELDGFGKVSFIDKFYFASPSTNYGIYDYGKFIGSNTMYLAQANEVSVNLIREPERTPKDLILLYSVAFPSGEPAFYVFTENEITQTK